MTQDPIQPLADIGRRVLQTVRHLVTPPGYNQLLDPHESLLLDPVVALSGICSELLERLAAAPVAAEHENLPVGPRSRPVPDPNARHAFPPFSHAGAVAPATRISGYQHDEASDPRRENPAAVRSDTPGSGFESPSPFEQFRRAMDDPAPLSDKPGTSEPRDEAAATHPDGAAPRAGNPARPPVRSRRSAEDGFAPRSSIHDALDRYAEARQIEKREPPSRSVPHPAERPPTDGYSLGLDGESLPEGRGETQRLARQEQPGTGRTEPPSDATARAGNGPTRGVGEAGATFPPNGSRLTASTEGLAAMLRAHVAQTEPEETSFTRPGDDGRSPVDEPARARPDSRVGVEEIMERLADELETGFVRTYGSSGG